MEQVFPQIAANLLMLLGAYYLLWHKRNERKWWHIAGGIILGAPPILFILGILFVLLGG